MKFTNGYWLKRDGVTVYSPCEVRDYRITDTSVILYVAPWQVSQRGMTLTGPLFTIKIASPQPGILSVETAHFTGGNKHEARFPLQNAQCKLKTAELNDVLTIISGDISVEIYLKQFEMVYRYCGRRLTATGHRKMGYAIAPDGSYMIEQLDLSVGEKIFGLGERFTPFVKNGQVVDIWNEDGGTLSEQAYKNIPFYLSSENYGVFVDHAEKVSYEIASEVVSRVQFSVPGETLRYCIIGGNSRKEVLEAYTQFSGTPALPPAWSFGLWLTTSFTTNYNEETVTSFVDGMAERKLPLHVFHYDCFWMKEYEWCNFEWDKDMFPDVEGMLARLKARGLKICVWINPYIGQKSPLFKEGAECGYLLKRPDGSVWQWDKWQPGMALVDFTNPAAYKWYQQKLRALLVQGVDAFKTDFGERIPTDVAYFNGADPMDMHNFYTYLYNQAVFELLEEEKGKGEAVLFARSATAGCQRFPVHWGGDCDSTFLSMAESLRGGLSLTLSGFGFWSHDIGGFENTATPDVYKRWVAFGLLSTHSRLHGSNSYRVPWLFDEEAVDVLRYFTNLKCRLMPYLFATAVHASKTGIPAMRAMLLEFEEDPACLDLDTQYMLGDSILVAPVFRKDGTARYYLPKGCWTHLLTGKSVIGDGWQCDAFDYFSLPVFVRENTLLPIGADDQNASYDYTDGLLFRLYALQDGKTAQAAVYGIDGALAAKATAKRAGDHYLFSLDDCRPEIMLMGIQEITALRGASAQQTPEGVKLIPSKPLIEFHV